MKLYIIPILLTVFLLNCKPNINKPIEISECGVNVEGNGVISGLSFDTQKDLWNFYTQLKKDYCTQINKQNYNTHYLEFKAINKNWYGDTIYIKSEEMTCVSNTGSKFTHVFLSFKNKYGKSILHKSTQTLAEIKNYFNTVYFQTAK